MFKPPFVLLFALLSVTAAAQSPDDEYYPYAEREERRDRLVTDSTLFHRVIQSAPDLYSALSDYSLPQVSRGRRGSDYVTERFFLGSLPVSYRLQPLLRLLGGEETVYPGSAPIPGLSEGSRGVRLFRFSDSEPIRPYRASVRYSNRSYLFGVRFSAWHRFGPWQVGVGVDGRTGRDQRLPGVFSHGATVGLRLTRRFSGGGHFALTFGLPTSLRGGRLSSTSEAFSLTGDPYYNPAWGYQSGRLRNSRVRRETVPHLVASFRRGLSDRVTLEGGFSVHFGTTRYSMLDWYDSRTPMPDHYRNLPSHTGDAATLRAWERRDPRYTQIDWDRLIRQNRDHPGPALYSLSDRVRRLFEGTLYGQARYRPVSGLEIRLDLRGGISRSRHFKRLRDLLGADYVSDIDQFLLDDDAYGSRYHNDLRHPDRRIVAGDRFGYDYSLHAQFVSAALSGDYRLDRFRVGVCLSVGGSDHYREGHYEKELFPGDQSYGRSPAVGFAPFGVTLHGGFTPSARGDLSFTCGYHTRSPATDRLFYQPLYNNRTLADPRPFRHGHTDLTYRHRGVRVELQASLYGSWYYDDNEVFRVYDDLSGLYSDVSVSSVDRFSYGFELGALFRLGRRFHIGFTAALSDHVYLRDSRVTMLSDSDNSLLLRDAPSRLGGTTVGGIPRFMGSVEFTFFGGRGWVFRASGGYCGDRYVRLSHLRRTDRVLHQGGLTPESYAALRQQERLGDSFTMDASLFRALYFGRYRVTAGLIFRNLLGTVSHHSGYESHRLSVSGPTERPYLLPQSTRYLHASPRTVYVTLSLGF